MYTASGFAPLEQGGGLNGGQWIHKGVVNAAELPSKRLQWRARFIPRPCVKRQEKGAELALLITALPYTVVFGKCS